MTQPKDLFGDTSQKKSRPSKLEKDLSEYDKVSFAERIERLKYLNKVFPKGLGFFGQMELIYTFGDVGSPFLVQFKSRLFFSCYINQCYGA